MTGCRSFIVLLDADDLACVEAECPEALSGEVLAFQTEMHLVLNERGIAHTTPWNFVAPQDRSKLEELQADIRQHWSRHARIEFEGTDLLNMAAFRHVAAFARLAWAVFVIGRALQWCRPACVYAFDEPPAHGLDQPPGFRKMPLLSGVVRGLAEQADREVRLIPRHAMVARAFFEDQVAKRSNLTLEPVDLDKALAARPYILFNGNGTELLRQLPLIHEIRNRTEFQTVQLYKDASADHIEQVRQDGHHVWHESQVVRFDPVLGIERTSAGARKAFDAAARSLPDDVGAVFNNRHIACHFDFLFGAYARKMAAHVCAWGDLFTRHRPAAFVANYHAPIYDVAAAMGIPCLALPHGIVMQGLPRWFLTLPRQSLVAVTNEQHRNTLITAGMAAQRIRVTGDPSCDPSETVTHRTEQAAHSDTDLRRRYQLPADQRIILLCTTSLGIPSNLPHAPIIDWAEAVRCTFDLAPLLRKHDDWIFVVRQHPRYDHPALYAAVNRTLPRDRRLILLPRGPLQPLVAGVDLVCIWNSVTSAIVEASLAGTPVVVFSKAMVWYDPEAWGCQAWTHLDDLGKFESELERLFRDAAYRAEQVRRTRRAVHDYLQPSAGAATHRCLAVINEIAHQVKRRDQHVGDNQGQPCGV